MKAPGAIFTVLLSLVWAALGFPAWTASGQVAGLVTIRPGEVWRDHRGEIIQAHGGGLIQVDKSYYWFGEDCTGQSSERSFQNINCYRSEDLGHWTFRGSSLTRHQEPGDLGPDRVVERPRVIYHAGSRTFVMYMHIDGRDRREAKVGVATSDRVDGVYTYRGSFRPLGRESGDLTLFQDTDGRGYLVFEDRGRQGVCIARLAPDCLSVESEVAVIPRPRASPALVKVEGGYFLLASGSSGPDLDSGGYAAADTLEGPWSEFKPVAPPAEKSHGSQASCILPVKGSRETSYIYVGDRWKNEDIKDSRYVWMPLRIDPARRTMILTPDAPWTVETATGFCSLPFVAPAPIK